MKPTIKLLSLIEATTVTGPAKNLLDFCRLARSPELADFGLPSVEVAIVTYERLSSSGQAQKSFSNLFVETARKEGVEVDVITERFRFDPAALSQLRKAVHKIRPDIIQTHMVKSHFLVKLTGLGKEFPWVAYHHGYTKTDLKMRAYNKLNLWSLPSASRVITVCGAFAEQLRLAGVSPERIVVCHNSVVPPRVVTETEQHALKDSLGILSDDKVILSVGRLSAEKGHHDLVEALVFLRELNPDLGFKLVIVGEGPERQSLQNSICEKELNDRVLFVGHITDVAPYYAIASVLALPSHSEGSPNVLLEAMAANVPVVATKVGGIPEIAEDQKTALLTAAENPRSFAVALNRLLSDPELSANLSVRARHHVAEQFSPEQHAHSLIRIHQQLLAERNGPATELLFA